MNKDIFSVISGDKPLQFEVSIDNKSILYLCSGILVTALLIIIAARLIKN